MNTVQRRLERIALALREQRLELGVSQRWLAAAAGIARPTLAKAERGGRIRPDLLLRAASVLLALELYAPPAPVADGNGSRTEIEDLKRQLEEVAS
jgi:transcriptional regulator with XRE-family HTH domain